METNLLEEVVEIQSDAELDELVASLPKSTVEAAKRYEEKMAMLNEIHKEVKLKHSDFQPEYLHEASEGINSDKYLYTYSLGTF